MPAGHKTRTPKVSPATATVLGACADDDVRSGISAIRGLMQTPCSARRDPHFLAIQHVGRKLGTCTVCCD